MLEKMTDDPIGRAGFSDPDKYVYHYTKRETALEWILPSMKLRLCPFESVNDPRESKIWFFEIYKGIGQNISLHHMDLGYEASALAKSTTLLLCCSADDPDLDPKERDYWFRRGFGYPRMWEQYADNHKGVCFVLDRELLHEAIRAEVGDEGLYHGRVTYGNILGAIQGSPDLAYPFCLQYSDIEKSGLAAVVDDHVHRFHREIFFRKHLNWRDECEYRWVFRGRAKELRYIAIEEALRAVIVGIDCSEVYLPSFRELCCNREITLHKMIWTDAPHVGPNECARS